MDEFSDFFLAWYSPLKLIGQLERGSSGPDIVPHPGDIGLAIGNAFAFGLTLIPDAGLDEATVPLWAVLMSFAFSATVGVVFGMFPAIKASRLDPIEALRHE
ncbi:MAG: hypothetical protein IIC10_03730 [Proteobacteria bacterium]|nr:hypothetical protein [Pseudomonadota bacterium]